MAYGGVNTELEHLACKKHFIVVVGLKEFTPQGAAAIWWELTSPRTEPGSGIKRPNRAACVDAGQWSRCYGTVWTCSSHLTALLLSRLHSRCLKQHLQNRDVSVPGPLQHFITSPSFALRFFPTSSPHFLSPHSSGVLSPTPTPAASSLPTCLSVQKLEQRLNRGSET